MELLTILRIVLLHLLNVKDQPLTGHVFQLLDLFHLFTSGKEPTESILKREDL